MRQVLLYDPLICTPHGLAHALSDDTLMQTYILDADITMATAAMAKFLAERDKDGKVVSSPVGGRRRIDYIMPRRGLNVVSVCGGQLITVLTEIYNAQHKQQQGIPLLLCISD